MYFRQFWNDPRLAFERRPGLNKIVVSGGSDYLNNYRTWVPDTFIVNEKTSHIHQNTVPNEFVRFLPSGDVLLSKRSVNIAIK